MGRRNREWKLFLDLCAPLSHEIEELPTDDEWRRILSRLEQTRFGALAYYNLRARGFEDAVPAQVMAHLRTEHARALAHYHLLGEMVSPHLEALAHEVDFLVLKGTAWAHTVYPEPHLRQSGDIDLLVRAEDQECAGRALEARGFEGSWACGDGHGPQFALAVPHAGVVYVELHPLLGRGMDHPHIDPEAAWARRTAVSLWGCHYGTPGNDVGVAHVAAQVVGDMYSRSYVRYLVDLPYLVEARDVSSSDLTDLLTTGGLCGAAHCTAALATCYVPLPRPRLAARLATRVVIALGLRTGPGVADGCGGTLIRLAALMLFDRHRDRRRRVRSYLRHARDRRTQRARDRRSTLHGA